MKNHAKYHSNKRKKRGLRAQRHLFTYIQHKLGQERLAYAKEELAALSHKKNNLYQQHMAFHASLSVMKNIIMLLVSFPLIAFIARVSPESYQRSVAVTLWLVVIGYTLYHAFMRNVAAIKHEKWYRTACDDIRQQENELYNLYQYG